jgi:hypothetical protein
LQASGFGLTSFFDCFNYNQKFLLTGFLSSSNMISISSCSLVSANLTINCNPPTNTVISSGYAGVINTGQFAMFSIGTSKNYIQICNLIGPIETQAWNSCVSYPDVYAVANAYVTEIVGNNNALMAKFADASWQLPRPDPSVHRHERRVALHRPHRPGHRHQQTGHLGLHGAGLDQLADPPALLFNQVGGAFSVPESTTSSTSLPLMPSGYSVSTLNVTVLKNIFDGVFLNTTDLPDFVAYENTSTIFLGPRRLHGQQPPIQC